MTMLDQALSYLKRGWSVVPLATGMKGPAVPWATYQHRLPTEEEVRRWWALNPEFSIGIVTGRVSGIAVVDVDPKRGGDADPFLGEYPTDLIVQTGGLGYHLYYRYPTTVENVPNLVGFRPGLDIRGDGGLVVAPPSLHASGNRYVWMRTGGMGSFPTELVEEKHRRMNERGWVAALVENGADSGERNGALAKLAGYFCSVGMGMDVAIRMCQMWNVRNRPPMLPHEVDSTVRSVYRTDERHKELSAKKGEKARDAQALVSGDFRFLQLREFMSRNLDQQTDEWAVSGWLPDRTIAFAISPPGSFKTWLTIDLAVSIATGTKFLNHFDVYRKGPVLLIQQEDFAGQTARRINAVVQSRFGMAAPTGEEDDFSVSMPPDIPIYVHPDRRLKFADKKAMASFEVAVEELKPALVIIDPLYSAGSTDDYMAKTAEQMFVLKSLRDKYNCSFLVAHHTKKSEVNDNEMNRDRLWGSQFLNAFLETGWQIKLDRKAEISVRRHFKSAPAASDIRVAFDIDISDTLRYHPIVTIKEAQDEVFVVDKLSSVYELVKKGPILMSQVAKDLKLSISAVSRKAKELENEGLLVRVKVPNSNSIMLHPAQTPDF